MSTILEGELGPVESKGYREVYTSVGSWDTFEELVQEARTVQLIVSSFPHLKSDKKLIVFTESEFNDYLKMHEEKLQTSQRSKEF